jgi:RND family efflux transporter MFP subunit
MVASPADLSRLKIDRKDSTDRSDSRPAFRKTVWIVLAAILVVSVGAYRFFASSLLEVEVGTVSSINPAEAVTSLNASGYVVAQRRAAVASKGSGRLVELKVREGDRVRKGELLARLESADVAAALARARANLDVAQSALDQAKAERIEAVLSYERKKNLIVTGMIPQAEFESAEARHRRAQSGVASGEAGVKAAEAAVRAAEVDLENTVIRAPFGGTILTKNADVGEMVAPFGSATSAKAAVVTMADMDSLQVEADVSESNIEKIRAGQRCEITLDAYPDAKYKGVVQAIVPTADRAKATVLTKIRFEDLDDRVLPEMSARVAFLSEPADPSSGKSVPAVSSTAVVARKDRKIVFRIDPGKSENRVREVPVETGRLIRERVEIRKGLAAGDRVVIHPPEGLSDGDRIRILAK